MISSLFTTDENNSVVVNPEALFIPEFKALKKRSRTNKRFLNELAYVYFIVAYNSPYSPYSLKIRYKKVGKDIFDNENYEPDDMVLKAMARYEDMQQTPSLKSLKTMYESLDTASDVFIEMRQSIEKEIVDIRASDNERDKDDKIRRCIGLIKSIIDMSDKMPNTIERIKKLEEEVKSERERIVARGGYSLNKREDPEYLDRIIERYKKEIE